MNQSKIEIKRIVCLILSTFLVLTNIPFQIKTVHADDTHKTLNVLNSDELLRIDYDRIVQIPVSGGETTNYKSFILEESGQNPDTSWYAINSWNTSLEENKDSTKVMLFEEDGSIPVFMAIDDLGRLISIGSKNTTNTGSTEVKESVLIVFSQKVKTGTVAGVPIYKLSTEKPKLGDILNRDLYNVYPFIRLYDKEISSGIDDLFGEIHTEDSFVHFDSTLYGVNVIDSSKSKIDSAGNVTLEITNILGKADYVNHSFKSIVPGESINNILLQNSTYTIKFEDILKQSFPLDSYLNPESSKGYTLGVIEVKDIPSDIRAVYDFGNVTSISGEEYIKLLLLMSAHERLYGEGGLSDFLDKLSYSEASTQKVGELREIAKYIDNNNYKLSIDNLYPEMDPNLTRYTIDPKIDDVKNLKRAIASYLKDTKYIESFNGINLDGVRVNNTGQEGSSSNVNLNVFDKSAVARLLEKLANVLTSQIDSGIKVTGELDYYSTLTLIDCLLDDLNLEYFESENTENPTDFFSQSEITASNNLNKGNIESLYATSEARIRKSFPDISVEDIRRMSITERVIKLYDSIYTNNSVYNKLEEAAKTGDYEEKIYNQTLLAYTAGPLKFLGNSDITYITPELPSLSWLTLQSKLDPSNIDENLTNSAYIMEASRLTRQINATLDETTSSTNDRAILLNSLRLRLELYYNYAKAGVPFEGEIGKLLTINDNTNSNELSAIYIGEVLNIEAYAAFVSALNELINARWEFHKVFESTGVYTDVSSTKDPDELEKKLRKNTDFIGIYQPFMKMWDSIQFLQNIALDYSSSGNEDENSLDYLLYTSLPNLQSVLDSAWYSAPSDSTNEDASLFNVFKAISPLTIDMSILDTYSAPGLQEPLGDFFNYNDSRNTVEISGFLKKGIVQSATFIPMRTNVYDPYTYASVDDESFYGLHNTYGYYRKALKIDTNHQSAYELYVTGKRSNLRVATLKDLIDNNGEIVLYMDENFYNVEELAKLRNQSFDKLDNEVSEGANTGWVIGDLWSSVVEAVTIDIPEVVKTAGKTTYSEGLFSFQSVTGVKTYEETKKTEPRRKILGIPIGKSQEEVSTNEYSKASSFSREGAVMPGLIIDYYVKGGAASLDGTTLQNIGPDYNVMRSFAFVSAIYRSPTLGKMFTNFSTQPVFISSNNLVESIADKLEKGAVIPNELRNAIINYAILENLSEQKTLSYETSLDMTSPIYMDIYGNILTESGIVVIPAASNATLNSSYSVINAGLAYSYGKSYSIPDTLPIDKVVVTYPENMFEKDRDSKTWTLQNIDNGYIDLSEPDIADTLFNDEIKKLWMDQIINNDNNNKFRSLLYVSNVFFEVVRGAPLDYIDLDKEALNVNRRLSISGIKAAVKWEEFLTNVKGKIPNNLMSLPNPAFIEGIDNIVYIVYKFGIVVIALFLIVQVFAMALKNRHWKEITSSVVMAIIILIVVIYTIPKVFEFSYYQVNKWLLQEEMLELVFYNTEKNMQGVEIGMLDIKAPSKSSTFLAKIDTIDIPWHSFLGKVITEDFKSNIGNLYEKEYENNLIANNPYFTIKGNTVYMDIQDLIESTRIELLPEVHFLYHGTEVNLPASFYTPYYYFLDRMVSSVNTYVNDNSYASYTTTVLKGGKIATIGLSEGYFHSSKFLEYTGLLATDDVLGIRDLYLGEEMDPELDGGYQAYYRAAQWFNDRLDEEDIHKRADKLEKFYIDYVKKNRALIGTATDETFLKTAALAVAIQYNKLFSIDCFDSVELYELSMEDLTRVGISNRADAIEGAPFDFIRYIFSLGGEYTIMSSAFMLLILMLTNVLKPIFVIIIYVLVFSSIFFNKIVKGSKEHSLEGYIFIITLLMSTNILYALMLKLIFLLPSWYISPIVCMLLIGLINVLFILIYIAIIVMVMANWKDLMGEMVHSSIVSNIANVMNKITGRGFSSSTSDSKNIVPDDKKEKEGWNLLDKMQKDDEYRNQSLGSKEDNPFR